MEYSIPEINNGVAKIQFSDGTWTFVELQADMTEAELDDVVYHSTPPHLKTGEAPSFLSEGATRTAQKTQSSGRSRATVARKPQDGVWIAGSAT